MRWVDSWVGRCSVPSGHPMSLLPARTLKAKGVCENPKCPRATAVHVQTVLAVGALLTQLK